jgi:2-phospho-L-lactate/phosphoenolpyruvate guanylyltransferase
MAIWAAVPVKPLAEGKSRLAGVLSVEERITLNGRLFRHILDALSVVFPADRIIVVSRDSAPREIARARGMQVVVEQGNALNEALDQAAMLPPKGDGLLAISTDLPNLTPDDIRALLSEVVLEERIVAIAPDLERKGTNALLTVPVGCVPYRFGEGSFAEHISAAAQHNIKPRIVSRPGLAFDLDTPDDLRRCPASFLR